ncbi:PREDICTED: retinol-binding protein 5 [Nanorana parkeri]|uniref:retinol-binding protein 5 n=1 Tax=Nanorana parkeri TaxID=125878 RepID=UPI00085490DB|nr:PREDICTED: retinol-binding protein 5 [Nanorana parkeri]
MANELTGKFALVSQVNMEGYLKALNVNLALRKIVLMLKPEKEFVVDGNHIIIKTLSTFKNYIMDFNLGEEFEENLAIIDGRICKTTVFWEGNKLVCVQKGEVPNRGWKQWLDGDVLHVELTARDVVSTQTFRKVP